MINSKGWQGKRVESLPAFYKFLISVNKIDMELRIL